LTGAESGAPELCIDNQSTITLCRNPVFHDKSKHIEEEQIIVTYTSTMEQLTDILTKAMGHVCFQELNSKI
jgi:hypothetical protein